MLRCQAGRLQGGQDLRRFGLLPRLHMDLDEVGRGGADRAEETLRAADVDAEEGRELVDEVRAQLERVVAEEDAKALLGGRRLAAPLPNPTVRGGSSRPASTAADGRRSLTRE